MNTLTIDTRPPCEHFDAHADALVYRRPPRRQGDREFACPCCGALAYAGRNESLMPCPTCDVDAVPTGH